LLIVLAVCAAVIAIIIALIPHEPKYDGRALSEWIKDSAPQKSPDPKTTSAVEAVRHIGTNGLPWLMKWISAKEPPAWQLKLTTANSRLPRWVRLRLLPSLFGINSYYAHRRMALDGFLILGPVASPAVPALLQMVGSSSGDSPAKGALGSIGTAGLAQTLGVLTNRAGAPAVRAAAADWLRVNPEFGRAAVVPALEQCLREKDAKVAKAAAHALVRLSAEPEPVVPFFIKLLQTGDILSRCDAAENLGAFREKARDAVPALVTALNDSDWYVRRAATKALFLIAPEALEQAIPGSVAAMKQSHEFGR
jgi:hypothetical protein